MLVEINTKKKVAKGDFLCYNGTSFEPVNLDKRFKDLEDRNKRLEEAIVIHERSMEHALGIVDSFNSRVAEAENKLERLEKVFENTIRGFITK